MIIIFFVNCFVSFVYIDLLHHISYLFWIEWQIHEKEDNFTSDEMSYCGQCDEVQVLPVASVAPQWSSCSLFVVGSLALGAKRAHAYTAWC